MLCGIYKVNCLNGIIVREKEQLTPNEVGKSNDAPKRGQLQDWHTII